MGCSEVDYELLMPLEKFLERPSKRKDIVEKIKDDSRPIEERLELAKEFIETLKGFDCRHKELLDKIAYVSLAIHVGLVNSGRIEESLEYLYNAIKYYSSEILKNNISDLLVLFGLVVAVDKEDIINKFEELLYKLFKEDPERLLPFSDIIKRVYPGAAEKIAEEAAKEGGEKAIEIIKSFLPLGEKRLELISKLTDDPEELALNYFALAEYDKALEYALKYLESIKDVEIEDVEIIIKEGALEGITLDELMKDLAQVLIKRAVKHKLSVEASKFYSIAAFSALALGREEEAMEYSKKAFEIASKIIYEMANMLKVPELDIGDIKKAKESVLKDFRSLVYAISLEVSRYRSLGEWEKAREELVNLIAVYPEIKDLVILLVYVNKMLSRPARGAFNTKGLRHLGIKYSVDGDIDEEELARNLLNFDEMPTSVIAYEAIVRLTINYANKDKTLAKLFKTAPGIISELAECITSGKKMKHKLRITPGLKNEKIPCRFLLFYYFV